MQRSVVSDNKRYTDPDSDTDVKKIIKIRPDTSLLVTSSAKRENVHQKHEKKCYPAKNNTMKTVVEWRVD